MERWQEIQEEIRNHFEALWPIHQRLKTALEKAAWLAVDLDRRVYAPAGCPLPYLACEVIRGRPDHQAVFLKGAGLTIHDVTRPVTNTFSFAQRALGGPNALTTGLVGGALGGLGGYGAGWLYDKFVPRALRKMLPQKLTKDGPDLDEVLDPSGTNMAGTLGTLGLIGGAGLGVARGVQAVAQGHSPLSAYPWLDLNPQYTKAAADTGALFIPSIPVDAFNRVVWGNALQAPNPFGTKDSFGTNEQQMFTPPNAAMAVGGLVSAAGVARNSEYVSPWDVARVATHAGINAGLGGVAGSVTGLAAGKLLGALAGLTPEAQSTLQRTGLWAGIVTGVANSIFR